MQLKDYETAKNIFEKVLIIRSKDPNTYHNLGVVFTQLKNFKKAIQCYMKAEDLNSKNSLTYYNFYS